jgi:hypothetical protein
VINPEHDSRAEVRAVADELLSVVSRLYRLNPAIAAADETALHQFRRSQRLLTPWLDSVNHFSNGLEVLHRDNVGGEDRA